MRPSQHGRQAVENTLLAPILDLQGRNRDIQRLSGPHGDFPNPPLYRYACWLETQLDALQATYSALWDRYNTLSETERIAVGDVE